MEFSYLSDNRVCIPGKQKLIFSAITFQNFFYIDYNITSRQNKSYPNPENERSISFHQLFYNKDKLL